MNEENIIKNEQIVIKPKISRRRNHDQKHSSYDKRRGYVSSRNKRVIATKQKISKKEEYFVEIVFEWAYGHSQKVILPFEDYNADICYEENMMVLLETIFTDGGFWWENKIIPFHRVFSLNCYKNNTNEQVKEQVKEQE